MGEGIEMNYSLEHSNSLSFFNISETSFVQYSHLLNLGLGHMLSVFLVSFCMFELFENVAMLAIGPTVVKYISVI